MRVEELCVLVRAVIGVGVLQPLGQDRLELAHVLEGEVEGLEPGDGGLGEVVAVELAQGQAHIALRVAKLNPLLLEHLGEGLELLQVRGLVRWEVELLRAGRGGVAHPGGGVGGEPWVLGVGHAGGGEGEGCAGEGEGRNRGGLGQLGRGAGERLQVHEVSFGFKLIHTSFFLVLKC